MINGLGGIYGWMPGKLAAQRPRGDAVLSPLPNPSFPRLEVAEVAACQSMTNSGTTNGTSYVTDEVLVQLLHGSSRLKELDVSGTRIGRDGILSIPEVHHADTFSIAFGTK